MQTKQCPYCKQNIAEKAYDLHLKLCPKKPKVLKPDEELLRLSEQKREGWEKKVEAMADSPDQVTSFLGKALQEEANKAKVEPPKAETEIPEPGTPEYLEYWRQLTTRGQQHELERRNALKRPWAIEPIEPIETKPVEAEEVVKPAVEQTSAVVTAPPASAPENGAIEVFYPKPDPYFLVSENIVEAIRVTEAISHKHPTNLLITGQPGGGKTSLAIGIAAKWNRPVVIADFGVVQEPQQLFQTTRLIESDGGIITDTRESGFIRGIETEGCVVIMDEFTRVENERCLNPLMPLLDGRKSCWIDELRRRVYVADRVIFVATINEGALFCGISSLDQALRERFREIFIDYLSAESESKVLEAKTGIPKIIANSLAEFAYTVRTTPAISKKISTRQLLHAAEAYAEGTSLWQAVEAAIGNYNDLEWRQQVMEIFSLNIKDEAEYKKWTTKKVGDRYVKY